jgi:hypothetical protein
MASAKSKTKNTAFFISAFLLSLVFFHAIPPCLWSGLSAPGDGGVCVLPYYFFASLVSALTLACSAWLSWPGVRGPWLRPDRIKK